VQLGADAVDANVPPPNLPSWGQGPAAEPTRGGGGGPP